jgi:hypothetical protein
MKGGQRVPRYIISLVALLSLLPLACTSASGEITASPGQEFSLAVGQSAQIAGEGLKIRFVEVVNDSRCPQGVECFWQGEVTCLIEITYQQTGFSMALTQPGLTSEPSETDFRDYKITFGVQPYPQAGKKIANKDYRLQMVITKPALAGGILVTFDVVGESYHIFITNQETIAQVFAMQRGESKAKIPSGRLVRGPVSYNLPWSWHIDSEDIHMAEVTIELCDGTPSQVEANLDYCVNTVKYFCPWSAKIVSIDDYR